MCDATTTGLGKGNLTIETVKAIELPIYSETDKFDYMQIYRRRNALLATLRMADECLVDYSDLAINSYEDIWPLNKIVRGRISAFRAVVREARNNAGRRMRNLQAKATEA